MSENKVIKLKDILNHPQVKKVTDDVNAATLERRTYSPPECAVFSNAYTVIEETDRYRFELDKEAEKLARQEALAARRRAEAEAEFERAVELRAFDPGLLLTLAEAHLGAVEELFDHQVGGRSRADLARCMDAGRRRRRPGGHLPAGPTRGTKPDRYTR